METRRVCRTTAGAALAALGSVLLPTIVVLSWFLPRIYEASALVRVIYTAAALENVDGAVVDGLTRTQGALALSQPLLEKVVRDLRLDVKWGEERAYDRHPLEAQLTVALLTRDVGVAYPRGTVGLMRIRAFSEDPLECRDIANAVAAAYVDFARDEPAQSVVAEAEVVEPAARPFRPVKPNFVLNILIGTLISGILMVTGVGLIVSRARRPRPPPVWV